MSADQTFVIAFLGALFAGVTMLLLGYTYVVLWLLPRLRRSLLALIKDAAQRYGFLPTAANGDEEGVHCAPAAEGISAVRVIFTCEDHGRCVGCLKVLAQFEAIIRHQGAESFDAVEWKCYEQLRDQLAADAAVDGEGEVDRQRRLATLVIETLAREGFSPSTVRSVVWGCGKDARETFARWLLAAREGCQKLIKDGGYVA